MVGGTIYVRGPVKGLTKLVWQLDLDDADREFLATNMPVFLEKIDRPQLLAELTDFSQWKKIVAMTWEERQRRDRITMKEFRTGKWVEGGIFGDVVDDDYDRVANFVNTGEDRLKIPHWQNKRLRRTLPDRLSRPASRPRTASTCCARARSRKRWSWY